MTLSSLKPRWHRYRLIINIQRNIVTEVFAFIHIKATSNRRRISRNSMKLIDRVCLRSPVIRFPSFVKPLVYAPPGQRRLIILNLWRRSLDLVNISVIHPVRCLLLDSLVKPFIFRVLSQIFDLLRRLVDRAHKGVERFPLLFLLKIWKELSLILPLERSVKSDCVP